jgi:hypothetical protein
VCSLCFLRRRIVGSDAVESGQRPWGRGGAVPSLHPSILETAKRGHDAGSETRPFVLFPASEAAITGCYR